MPTSEFCLPFLRKFSHFLSCALWQSDSKLRSGCQMANNELLMSRPSRRCLDPHKKKSLSYLDRQNFQSENISHFIWNMLENGGKGTSKPRQTLYFIFFTFIIFFFWTPGGWVVCKVPGRSKQHRVAWLGSWGVVDCHKMNFRSIANGDVSILMSLSTWLQVFGRAMKHWSCMVFLTFPSCKTQWSGWAAASGGFAAVPQQTGWAWQVGSYPLKVNDRFVVEHIHATLDLLWSLVGMKAWRNVESEVLWPRRDCHIAGSGQCVRDLCTSHHVSHFVGLSVQCGHVMWKFTGFFQVSKTCQEDAPGQEWWHWGSKAKALGLGRMSEDSTIQSFCIILYHFVAISAAAATVSVSRWRDVGGSMVQVPSHERAIWGFEEKTRRGQSSKLMAARFRAT